MDFDDDDDDEDDSSAGHSASDGVFYVVRKPHKQRPAYSAEDHRNNGVYLLQKPHKQQPHKKKKIVVEVQDYNDDYDAQPAAATQYRHRQRGTDDDADDEDVDDLSGSVETLRDYDRRVQQERYRKQQQRFQQQQHRGRPAHSVHYDRQPAKVHRSRRPTNYYQPNRHYGRPATSSIRTSERHRQHRYELDDTDVQHYRRRSPLRTKYIWDRHTDFGDTAVSRFNDPQLGEVSTSGEDASSPEQLDDGPDTGIASIDDEDDQRYNRRRVGYRTTGVDLPGFQRATFNQDLNDRLDRNYDKFWGNGADGTDRVPQYNAQTTGQQQQQQQQPPNNDQAIGTDESADEIYDFDATDSDDGADTETASLDVAERRQFTGFQPFQRRWDGPSEAGRSLHDLNFQALPSSGRHTNSTVESRRAMQEKAVFEVPRIDRTPRRIYGKWSKWSKCSVKCTTKRWR